jgi:hypothetical protein
MRIYLGLVCHPCILEVMYTHPYGPSSLCIYAPKLFSMMQAAESSISGIICKYWVSKKIEMKNKCLSMLVPKLYGLH